MACKIAVRNLLKDAVVTMTPSAEPDLEEQYLSDGPGGLGAMFGSLAADPEVLISLGLDISFGNGLETGAATGDVLATSPGSTISGVDIVTPWEVDSPPDGFLQIFDDATLGFMANDHGGNGFTLGLGATTDPATAKLALVARAGATYTIKGWVANGTGASNAASIRLLDTVRNLYLKTDGTWDASPQDLVLDSTADHVWLGIAAGAGVAFTLPTAAEIGGLEDVDLELQLVNGAVGFALFDDLSIQQTISADLMMVAGNHNFQSEAVLKWQTSDDGASWTDRATFTVLPFQFWALLDAPVTAPYHRLKMTGTPIAQHFAGELILGLTQVIPNGPEPELGISYEEKGQARLAGPAGVEYVSNRGPYPPRTISFSMTFRSAAETQTAIGILVDQLRGGRYEAVLIPEDEQLPWLAIFGRVPQPMEFRLSPRAGNLPSGDGQEHYARVSVVFVEGGGFQLDD